MLREETTVKVTDARNLQETLKWLSELWTDIPNTLQCWLFELISDKCGLNNQKFGKLD
jgi:hypothetical protein